MRTRTIAIKIQLLAISIALAHAKGAQLENIRLVMKYMQVHEVYAGHDISTRVREE